MTPLRHQLPALLAIIALCAVIANAVALATNATTAPSVSPATNLVWLTSLDSAYLQSQRTQQPILLFVESRGDPASQKALQALESCVAPDAGNWVLARLDVHESREAFSALGISTVPAIRMLAPTGRLTASLDQPLTISSISQWLSENRPAAAAPGPPANPPSRGQLLAQLASADAAQREMAVRQLAPDRAAAGDVINLLFTGTMAARLASLDLLQGWGAPIGDLDPWDRSSLTNDRRKALELWLQSAATEPGSATVASGVSPDNMEIELDELLLAPTDADARAVREQLVRFGQAALPAVYQRLKAAPNDTARQRLTALRYRLVATDRLAAEWPGGFDRLASADPFVRRAATDELAQHVTADDLRLLVELFGDKDEFVRERSLKILRAVGGPETNKALMKLLQDPDSNVRAAVLKTLAEAPDPALAPDLVRYAASENDADLVVHTIHVLQDIPGETSANGLKDLLSHPQWRVRAEACEAIHQKLQSHEQMSPAQAAVLISGLSKCLNDTDQFVVSQAAAALIAFHLSPADKAVMQAIDRNPELAVALLAGIARDRDSAVMLLPAIRKLTSNPEPQIRASAIGAICEFDPRSAGPALSAGLKDQDASVRQAAANGLVTVLDEISPQDGVIFLEPGNYQTAQTNVDGQQWATAFMTGNGRPSWMPPLKPDLERLLKDSDEPTRVAAAVSLCALGHANEAWPVLAASSSSEIARATEATALPFLDWDQRKTLFDRLVAITPDGQMHRLIDKFATIPDPRAAPELWNLLRDPPREALLSDVNSAMSKIYELNGLGGSSLFGSMVSAMFSAKPSPVKDATAMLQTGHDLQKTEALSLLYAAAPDAVAKPAKEIFQDHHNSPGLRNDALQVLLVSLPDQEAQAAAASALSDAAIRKTAACYLAVGGEAITALRGDVYLQSHSTSVVQYEFGQQPEPIIHVNAPAGLQVAQVSDLLNDPDQDLAGYAGYLAAVLGDHNGLVPLLKAARAHDFDVSSWGRLVYRAIAKLDDDSQTPVLEEVYKSFAQEPWAMREFYWTIRSMHGPNILKLRKKIRDEVGMAQLQ